MASKGHLQGFSALVVMILPLVLTLMPLHAYAQVDTQRLGGTDRYETMALISREGFAASTSAIVATGDNFPDALTASALAGTQECPVLLTPTSHLAQEARSELVRLGVTSVYIAGGPNAVSDKVEREIRGMGIDVQRVAGKDRVETSVEILKATRAAGSSSDTVIIATGAVFADSLSIGPWAWQTRSPIILVRDGKLSTGAIKAIKADKAIKRVIIVGSLKSVDPDVELQLGSGYRYSRLCGPDRYQTCAAIAMWEGQFGLGWSSPALATGENFPDALAGAPLMGKVGSTLLLTNDSNTVAHGIIANHAPLISHLYVLGGDSTIAPQVAYDAHWLLNVVEPDTAPVDDHLG